MSGGNGTKADGKDKDEANRRRLAAALRENLKRRKAQARGRRDGTEPASPAGAREDTV